MNTSKTLDWDSDFFGLKIGAINLDCFDGEFLTQELNHFRSNDYDLVYIFVHNPQINLSTEIMSSYNCILVDTKIIYHFRINEVRKFSPDLETHYTISEYNGGAQELYDLAIQSGVYSRYKLDPNFLDDDFERLYYKWIDNSVEFIIADKIFVFKDGALTCGFVTVKKQDNVIVIGLLATDIKYRGRGIAKSLIEAVIKYAISNNGDQIEVATQKNNIQACSLYEKIGMTVYSETRIYHSWLKK